MTNGKIGDLVRQDTRDMTISEKVRKIRSGYEPVHEKWYYWMLYFAFKITAVARLNVTLTVNRVVRARRKMK